MPTEPSPRGISNKNHTGATAPQQQSESDASGTSTGAGVANGPSSFGDTQSLGELCAKVHERVQTFLDAEPRSERIRAVQEQSRIGLRVVKEALERYSLDELSLSYNGGKDCLVLLILYLCALHTHTTSQTTTTTTPLPPQLNSIYITSPHPFPEIDAFVATSSHEYHLHLSRYSPPMKSAFALYLTKNPNIKAIFVGTRRTDPHGADLQHFDPTDRGWPSFMRVHPVIDWHYAEVWTFIRELGVEYCPLYDQGYTSLGGTEDTWPNPALRKGGVEGESEGGFRPAYELVEDGEERLGRDR